MLKVIENINDNEELIEECHKLDCIVYKGELVGTSEHIKDRNRVCKDSLLCVVDTDINKVVGYICYFPCKEELWNKIKTTDIIIDDDIKGCEIKPFEIGNNNVYLLSIVIHPDYQNGIVIKLMSNAWIAKLRRFNDNGYIIKEIIGTAVSKNGREAMTNYNFKESIKLSDGYTEFICTGQDINKLLSGDICGKS